MVADSLQSVLCERMAHGAWRMAHACVSSHKVRDACVSSMRDACVSSKLHDMKARCNYQLLAPLQLPTTCTIRNGKDKRIEDTRGVKRSQEECQEESRGVQEESRGELQERCLSAALALP